MTADARHTKMRYTDAATRSTLRSTSRQRDLVVAAVVSDTVTILDHLGGGGYEPEHIVYRPCDQRNQLLTLYGNLGHKDSCASDGS